MLKILEILDKYSHVVVLDFLFIAFVFWNKMSVVLGDKSSHDLVIHLAQINHLMIFSLFFFPSVNFINFHFFKKIIISIYSKKFDIKNTFIYIGIFITLYGLILFFNRFSFFHDYILSDNRHYSFYYFNRIYSRVFLRHIILLYISLTYSIIIYENLIFFRNSLFIAWIICMSLAIVPAKLFEFRYFSPCYITFLLIFYSYLSVANLKNYILNKVNIYWSIIVNFVTIYIFIFKSFYQKEFPETDSRFMW